VALVRLSAIGDTIHAMPIVASLSRAWPQCRITWVIQPGPYELMRGHPDVSEFILFDRELGMRAYTDFRRRVKGRRFDLVLDVHPYLKAGIVTRTLDAPIRLGYDRARARDLSWLFTNRRIEARPPGHVQDQYFEFLEHLGVPVVAEWDFCFTEEERAARDAFFGAIDGPVLAIVLCSSRAEKDWTLDRYARVVEVAQRDLGFRAIVVGGGSARERTHAARLRSLCRAAPGVELRYDLRRLAWILDGSSLVLSPDSGPLHLAVALGTPTIGLYGTTDPKRCGPYRRFGDLLIDRYTRPGESLPSRRRRPGNMVRITVDDVLDKLELARQRYVTSNVDVTWAK
jgi:heptosyltransferase I